MKERISATVEKETIKNVGEIMRLGRFRNKSHVIEESIEHFLKKLRGDKNVK